MCYSWICGVPCKCRADILNFDSRLFPFLGTTLVFYGVSQRRRIGISLEEVHLIDRLKHEVSFHLVVQADGFHLWLFYKFSL